ncbi:U3 snoRNP protein [Coniosporium apollinis]|uniref:U3 snoRNP protein n=1 Tax=Coniosporium apollinis TaxID=61459 RepID=A0ABQ9P284_9PEZI|nr:U3 snoRNP protein [Coniosporium apollinis]
MAPPALKRRKLSHSLNEDDGSLAQPPSADTSGTSDDEDIPSDASNADLGSVATSSQADEDEEMVEDDADGHDEEEGSAEEEDDLEDEEQSKPAPQKVGKAKPSNGHQHTQRANGFQGEGYTGEVYKSNLFKLQVDELLQRVRPRHGKKEAPAEDALRTLKGIIERIPDREPQNASAFGSL